MAARFLSRSAARWGAASPQVLRGGNVRPVMPLQPLLRLLRHNSTAPDSDTVQLTFVHPEEGEKVVTAKVATSLLDVAHENDVELEGACGGELACSTCHVILPESFMSLMPPVSEEEEDMLDLAWGVTETSRLGCQIKVTKEMDGMVVRLPDETLNLM